MGMGMGLGWESGWMDGWLVGGSDDYGRWWSVRVRDLKTEAA